MRIGELAAQAGVSTSLIRFYERKGLLTLADRSANGYRSYGPRDLKMIAFIERAQRLGFSLKDIGAFLASALREKPGTETLIVQLQAKLHDIDVHLLEGRKRREEIVSLIEELSSQRSS